MFIFRIYDASNCWYKQIVNPAELRSQISQALRNTKDRITREQKQAQAQAAAAVMKVNNKERQRLHTGNDDGNQAPASVMGLDLRRVKRFKKDDDSNCILRWGCKE